MRASLPASGLLVGITQLRMRAGASPRMLAVLLAAGLLTMLASPFVAPAAAADPDGVSISLDGCRNGGTITLPNAGGNFICPDAAYTSGNLGKGWNELDLVPYRVTRRRATGARRRRPTRSRRPRQQGLGAGPAMTSCRRR